MKRNAYANSTIKATAKRLKHLKKHPIAYENTKKYAKKALEKMKKLESLFT